MHRNIINMILFIVSLFHSSCRIGTNHAYLLYNQHLISLIKGKMYLIKVIDLVDDILQGILAIPLQDKNGYVLLPGCGTPPLPASCRQYTPRCQTTQYPQR